VPKRDGLYPSPFRADAKPSFSVSKSLTLWKDFASGDKAQGVWGFVQACRPDWTKGEVAKYIIAKSGLQEEAKEHKSRSQLAKERAERNKQRIEHAEAQRRNALRVDEPTGLQPWSGIIEDWFNSADPTDQQIEALANRRGWDVDWVYWLSAAGMLRWPELPWKAARYAALTVQAPVHAQKAMMTLGYHQRIWSSDASAPAWLFVPWSPKSTQGGSLMQHCAALATSRGIAPGVPMICPAPFVLGNPWTAKLWVVTEGQWDAITFFGAVGGFYDQQNLPIAVFGLRGSTGGTAAFLGLYQRLIRAQKPAMWLIRDNDPAGAKWTGAGSTDFAHPGVLFRDQLQAVYAGHPSTLRVKFSSVPSQHGKDLNDWWMVSPEACTSAIMKQLTLFLK
jgi:hypothetical protein